MMGFNFPTDSGPVMSGTWFNRRTQDSFTVRDVFLEDNQMIVLTTDGRRLDYNTIQEYEQVNDKQLPLKNDQQRGLPPEVASMVEDIEALPAIETQTPASAVPGMLPEDMTLIQTQQAQPTNDLLHTPINQLANKTPAETMLTEADEEMRFTSRTIKRALDRAKKDPEIAVGIKWNKYPEKQMEMLVDYMGIDVEDIVSYYIDKIDLNAIRQKLECEIRLFIEKKFTEVEEGPKETKPKETKPKSTTRVSTKTTNK